MKKSIFAIYDLDWWVFGTKGHFLFLMIIIFEQSIVWRISDISIKKYITLQCFLASSVVDLVHCIFEIHGISSIVVVEILDYRPWVLHAG